MAKNVRLGALWNRQGYNLVIEAWGRGLKFKIWPPKKGDYKNGKSSPEREVSVSPSLVLEIGHMARRLIKSEVGSSETTLFRQKDKAAGVWNNIMLISLKKELVQNALYTLSINFCNDGTTYDFAFTKPETIVTTSSEPNITIDSTNALMDFIDPFHNANILDVFCTASMGDGPSVNMDGNGGSESKAFGGQYGNGPSEFDIPQ